MENSVRETTKEEQVQIEDLVIGVFNSKFHTKGATIRRITLEINRNRSEEELLDYEVGVAADSLVEQGLLDEMKSYSISDEKRDQE